MIFFHQAAMKIYLYGQQENNLVSREMGRFFKAGCCRGRWVNMAEAGIRNTVDPNVAVQ